MLFYAFVVASAALVPISDMFFPVLREKWSWWLVPLLFIGFFLALLLLFAAFCTIAFAVVNTDKSSDKGARLYRRLCNELIELLVRLLRVDISTSGKDMLPDNGRFLLVCNHLNNIDPAVILYSLPESELGFIAKKEIYETMPLIAKAMHKLYCLPIDRENNRAAARTVIEAVRLLREDKASIGLFPEGKVSRSGELLPLKPGSLNIATRAEVPIVITTVLGTPRAAHSLFFKKSHIYFDVIDIIPAAEAAATDTTALAEKIHSIMLENLEKRKKEQPELSGGIDSFSKVKKTD